MPAFFMDYRRKSGTDHNFLRLISVDIRKNRALPHDAILLPGSNAIPYDTGNWLLASLTSPAGM
jgi:hypothetical protein